MAVQTMSGAVRKLGVLTESVSALLAPHDAERIAEGDDVFLRKNCPEHRAVPDYSLARVGILQRLGRQEDGAVSSTFLLSWHVARMSVRLRPLFRTPSAHLLRGPGGDSTLQSELPVFFC